MDFYAQGMAGLDANILDTLVSAAGAAVGTVGKDVPKPLERTRRPRSPSSWSNRWTGR